MQSFGFTAISCALLMASFLPFFVSAKPIDMGNSESDKNEHDQVLHIGENFTISCEEPSYPPAMLFAQDLDRDHYHVVFFGLQQIDNDDIWTAQETQNGTIEYTLQNAKLENAGDYVCNQPRQDHPNERIGVVASQPDCSCDVDGETGQCTSTGHCILNRKGFTREGLPLAMSLKVVGEDGVEIPEVTVIEGTTFIEAVFNFTSGFTC